MKMRKLILASIILVLLDQATKYLMHGREYFSGFVSLRSTINYGAAFSMLQGWNWLFISISVIVIFGISYYHKRFKNKLGIMLLLAGTAGNLIDRLLFGYVRDFISVRHFATFNLADSFNVIGAALIIYFSYMEERAQKALNTQKHK